MLKQDEIESSNSCLNRAEPGEMIFVLLARDASAPTAIRFWTAHRIATGKNKHGDAKISDALMCADVMEAQRADMLRKRKASDYLRSDAFTLPVRPGADPMLVAEIVGRIISALRRNGM